MYNSSQILWIVFKRLFFLLVSFLINAIILWRVFKKAGEKPSNALIPFYRRLLLFRIIDLSKLWFWIYIGVFVLSEILLIFSEMISNFSAVILIIALLGMVLSIIIHILETDQLGNSFNKTKGYKIGYFFLPTLFGFILAFDKSKYIGPNGVKLSKSKRKKLKKK